MAHVAVAFQVVTAHLGRLPAGVGTIGLTDRHPGDLIVQFGQMCVAEGAASEAPVVDRAGVTCPEACGRAKLESLGLARVGGGIPGRRTEDLGWSSARPVKTCAGTSPFVFRGGVVIAWDAGDWLGNGYDSTGSFPVIC
jgi:hypothetical protein